MTAPARPGTDLATVAHAVWESSAGAGFRGADPYDGLRSGLLRPLLPHSRLLRLAVIQGVKRSPVNLRPLLRIPPGLNPKGLSLFLHGAALHPGAAPGGPDRATLGDRLLSLASLPGGAPYFGSRDERPGLAAAIARGETACAQPIGWGYDFPWQAVAFLQPPYYPTVVATSFAADALNAAGSPAAPFVDAAAARFVLELLHRHETPEGVCFSYSPRDGARVVNASLFAAKILARAAATGGARAAECGELARRAADYAAARQQPDGSWLYGEASHWGWIDGLHTGFVLETLEAIAASLRSDAWDDAIARGLSWYRARMFDGDARARYYPDRDYPRDPHTAAQAALTFVALRRHSGDGLEFAGRVLASAVAELWDPRRRGFVTRRGPRLTDRTMYMRWSQAWMFRALCGWLAAAKDGKA